ncbi:MAG: hypothetical protein ACR2HJ_00060 [Fimbriimonadales bacterium]
MGRRREWEDGVMADMGVPSGYIWSFAQAINERGIIAGISEDINGLQSAIAWYKGTIATLPTLGGDNAFAMTSTLPGMSSV